MILSACSSYLQWVGVRDCSKPLLHPPTLAGLQGGVAGDLGRLYPLQSMAQLPLAAPPPASPLTVLPFTFTVGNKEVRQCLGKEEIMQWGDLLASASHTLQVPRSAV